MNAVYDIPAVLPLPGSPSGPGCLYGPAAIAGDAAPFKTLTSAPDTPVMERLPLLEAVCFVLDRHSDPLFIVDGGRKLQFWNVSARRVLEARQCLRQHRGRLSMGSPPEDRRLEQLLESIQAAKNSGREHSRGLRLHRPGTQQGWVVAIHPLRGTHGAGGPGPLFLLHAVSRLHSRGTLDPLLRDLFGLTPAEIAAALALLHSGSVGDAARVLSVSRETVRTQLKAVFRKCDIHSTVELAALLRSASLFLGPDPSRAPSNPWSESRGEAP